MRPTPPPYIYPGQSGYLTPADDDGELCDSGASEDGFFCTRPGYHYGDHAAHDSENRQLGYWPNEDDSVPDDISVVPGLIWCALEAVVLSVGINHMHTCPGPHKELWVGDVIQPKPHVHNPQVMRNAARIPVSVCCTGLDGCGYNEELDSAGWSKGTAV